LVRRQLARGQAPQLEAAQGEFEKAAQIADAVGTGPSLELDLKNWRGGTDAVGFQRLLRWVDSCARSHLLWRVVAALPAR
jgi:hypothetical protein